MSEHWLISVGCSKLEITTLVDFIIPKYASYQIRPLLLELRRLFTSLYSVDSSVFLATVTRRLDSAVQRVSAKANAVSNYFTLLDWVNHVLILTSRNANDLSKYLPELVTWQATLLYHCLSEAKKKGMTVSALRSTRACLRAVFQSQTDDAGNKSTVEHFIAILVGSKVSPFTACVSLGIVAGVSKRLKYAIPTQVVNSSKNIFHDFATKEIIGSKLRVPRYVMVLTSIKMANAGWIPMFHGRIYITGRFRDNFGTSSWTRNIEISWNSAHRYVP